MNKTSSPVKRHIASAISAVALSAAMGAVAQEDIRTFQIAEQPLAKALIAFSNQSDIVVIAPSTLVNGLRAPSIAGDIEPEKALQQLLASSGLDYTVGKQGFTIVQSSVSDEGSSKNRLERDDKKANQVIEEMIVTATKRSESIQDVAMSISAIGSEDIERKNLLSMNDYLRTLPGVNMIDMGPGRNTIIMRGVSVDPQFEDKVVGAYFGETPVTELSNRINDGGSSDFMMVDINRVEVLRGPQGTLYGSGSMGGTVRIIPNSPNLNAVEGSVLGGVSNTEEKGGINNRVEGMVNIPLIEDVLAVRGVAYRFDNSGYVENVAATSKAQAVIDTGAIAKNEGDIGSHTIEGFRISALWQPTDNFSVELSHAAQDTSAKGRSGIDLTLDDYQQDRFVTPFGDENIEDDITATNLLVKYDFGWSSLLASSSWASGGGTSIRNFGGGSWETIPVSQFNFANTDTFTEEIRLASQLDGPLQFVVGLYYEKIDTQGFWDNRWGGDPELSNDFGFGFVEELGTFGWDPSTKQKAAFGEVTYNFNEQFSVTGGARIFKYEKHNIFRVITPGIFSGGGSPGVSSVLSSDENEDSYKINFSYTPDEDKLFYLSWSEGFRLGQPIGKTVGGPCDVNGDSVHDDLGIPFPSRLNSDFLENTEIGTKLSFLDRRLTLNLAAYDIKWKGLPVLVGVGSPCGSGVTINAGSASSKGFEAEASYQATDNFYMSLGASYVDATIGVDAPGLGEAGDRLPGMPDYTVNLGLQYDFLLADHEAYIRSDYSYVGGFYGNLPGTGAEAGDYHQLNVKSGVSLGNIDVNVFINNLANSNALIWVDAFDPAAHQMRPRTMGLNIAYNF